MDNSFIFVNNSKKEEQKNNRKKCIFDHQKLVSAVYNLT